jgi:hypothetical protein
MPREAKLFDSVKGSPTRALSRLEGNIPPAWIKRARATIATAVQELRGVLKAWELAYQKETFYGGLRALLEISRNGTTSR